MRSADPGRWLVGAGAATWVVVGVPEIARWATSGEPFGVRTACWCAAYATFGAAFFGSAMTEAWGERARVLALVVQSVMALVIAAVERTGFAGALLCVVAGQSPFFVRPRVAVTWVAFQAVTLFVVERMGGGTLRATFSSSAAYGAFQFFAFGAARLAASEGAARRELLRVHAELVATRELFADSTRTAERLRISRELHDALGHHLTALSLQLEVARNVAKDDARASVERAHALTKELLTEVRAVVSTMREEQPIELARTLRALVAGIEKPRVHLHVPDELRVEPTLAHAIFRCVQESLTNALRHAGARNLHVTIEARDDRLSVTATDDGRGAASVRAGNGLTGVRERIEELGGSVELEGRPGEGFLLRARLPSRGGGS